MEPENPCDACGADTGSPDVYYCNSSCRQTAIYRKAAELRKESNAVSD